MKYLMTFESLLRKSTLTQMKRINAEIKKAGGDIEDKVDKTDRNFPNQYWVDNPFDSDRQVATIDDHMKIDIPESSNTKKKSKKKKKKK